MDTVHVDCDTCVARGPTCADCVVTVLLGAPPHGVHLDADEQQALAELARGRRLPLAWLVGPEGGFERAELDDLRRRAFVAPVSLGPRILRAETAAVAGLAILQALAGDWTIEATRAGPPSPEPGQ